MFISGGISSVFILFVVDSTCALFATVFDVVAALAAELAEVFVSLAALLV